MGRRTTDEGGATRSTMKDTSSYVGLPTVAFTDVEARKRLSSNDRVLPSTLEPRSFERGNLKYSIRRLAFSELTITNFHLTIPRMFSERRRGGGGGGGGGWALQPSKCGASPLAEARWQKYSGARQQDMAQHCLALFKHRKPHELSSYERSSGVFSPASPLTSPAPPSPSSASSSSSAACRR